MKKLATLATTGAIFTFSALPVLAQYGLPYGTVTGLGTKDLRAGVMGIVNALLGFLGIIAIVIILWGGFRWMTSAGNEEKVGEAKKIITAGIIGLIIIFISYAIATFVITELVTATGATPIP
ncbi:MAG: hypothetical protein A3A24_02485 [Candidatus Buchananbacteria bacterium RIFCSPLOWO2_01_FULL_46_12]|uniref:Uncharacterized protein n=1 Tax=Candidatus Buchananbacteria bacterium RIFCSPLOWO2_01_FULL_46_12 TaxID=1797546 RepID=A0A1G1YRW8_9BACT|nr:MAG: hypothetical protein A3A24_02485 [Candidatus Buchananbacteria bacterium RIFCSPLOWO2_01_FULL_46_12]